MAGVALALDAGEEDVVTGGQNPDRAGQYRVGYAGV
jgi:hypothetical protein